MFKFMKTKLATKESSSFLSKIDKKIDLVGVCVWLISLEELHGCFCPFPEDVQQNILMEIENSIL